MKIIPWETNYGGVYQMKKWIYKIINNINGKIYIGQSNNPQRRFKEHINDEGDSLIHNAIKKYGEENFSFEIIEGPIENFNEREKYWIKVYDSYTNGYNMTLGGEEPPIIKGEKSQLAKFSDELILSLQLDLINTDMSYDELSKKYCVTTTYLTKINLGEARNNPKFIYPLRKSSNCTKTKNFVIDIINELLYTTKSVEQIARDFQIDSLTIYRINLGKQKNCPKNIQYPIRNKGERISNKMLFNIIKDLLDNKLKFKEIEKKYNLSKSTISKINQGKQYKRDNFNYPLRPSNKRVYNQNL